MLTVVRGIFLAIHQGLGVEQRAVATRSHLIDDARLKIHVKGARDVLARGGLREESAKAIVMGRRRTLNKTPIRLQESLKLCKQNETREWDIR